VPFSAVIDRRYSEKDLPIGQRALIESCAEKEENRFVVRCRCKKDPASWINEAEIVRGHPTENSTAERSHTTSTAWTER